MSSESIRVLLVEDNLGDARLLYEGMQEALPGQFQMTHVKRLSEALEFLWKETCDVVLLDLGLPDSHGIDTLVLTRAQAPSVPIVVLTGFQDESLADQALKEGAQEYLVKGQVDSKLLARSMRYAIARKAMTEALIGQGVALAKARVLQVSRQRLIATHERARRDIASQLHEGVQKRLIELKECIRELKRIESTSETTRLLCDAIDGMTQKIDQVVGIVGRQLYPSMLNTGMAPAFQSFRDQFGSALDLEIELDEYLVKQEQVDRNWIPVQVGLSAYRIAEEALTTMVKHAKTGKVTVRLDSSQEGPLRLTVRDNGQGFCVDGHPDDMGMGTMQDYAEAMDGECLAHCDSGGFEIAAALPLARSVAVHLESSKKGDK